MPKARREGFIQTRGESTFVVGFTKGRDRDGRRKYHHETVRGSRKDARRRLNEILRERDRGTFTGPSKLTVDDYLDQWLDGAVRPRASQRTADGYAALLKRYARGPLGVRRLDELQPLDIQKVYAGMLARGLSGRTIRHAHSALHNALRQAVKWRMIAPNPAELVELP